MHWRKFLTQVIAFLIIFFIFYLLTYLATWNLDIAYSTGLIIACLSTFEFGKEK